MSPPPVEFRNIKTFADWKTKLRSLLVEAGAVAEMDTTGDEAGHRAVLDLNKRLTAFQLWSDPEIDGTEELDDIANQVRIDLLQDSINRRIQAIAARSATLESLSKSVEVRAAEDNAIAAHMRGEALHAALGAINSAVTAGISLEKSLDTDTDAEFAKKLKKTLNSLQELRNQVETMTRE